MDYFARRVNNLQAQKVPQITSDPQTPQRPTDLDGAEDASESKSRHTIHTTKIKSSEKDKNKCYCHFKFGSTKENVSAGVISLRQSQHLKDSSVP